MAAGLLNERVELLRREVTTSSTGSGAQVEDFTSIGWVYCRVMPTREAEQVRGGALDTVTTHRFRVRWRPDLATAHATTWRLKWNERVYDIGEILPAGDTVRDPPRIWLDLTATASGAENPTE